MNLSGSTALVTGADGFVGHQLCERLVSSGCRVRGLIRPGPIKNLRAQDGLEIVRGDVTDYPSLQSAMEGIDVVFHLAALTNIPETRSVILNTFTVNCTGTLNALLAAKDADVKKFLLTSSAHVYGPQEVFPLAEEATPNPIDIYSVSKLSAEHLCKAFVDSFGLDVTIARAFNHYGPRQRTDFLIPSVISRLLRGQPLQLGSPLPTRDYVFVEDVLSAYVSLAERGRPGQVYNVCSGEERTVEQVVDTVIRLVGSPASPTWDTAQRRIDIPRVVGTAAKIRDELGWRARVDLEEGLRRTIEWYRESVRR